MSSLESHSGDLASAKEPLLRSLSARGVLGCLPQPFWHFADGQPWVTGPLLLGSGEGTHPQPRRCGVLTREPSVGSLARFWVQQLQQSTLCPSATAGNFGAKEELRPHSVLFCRLRGNSLFWFAAVVSRNSTASFLAASKRKKRKLSPFPVKEDTAVPSGPRPW